MGELIPITRAVAGARRRLRWIRGVGGTLRALLELNVVAPLALTQLALPHLVQRRGTVVMVSSIAGIVAAPRYAAYSASKFALEGISMAKRTPRSRLVEEALRFWRHSLLEQQLKDGYQSMAAEDRATAKRNLAAGWEIVK